MGVTKDKFISKKKNGVELRVNVTSKNELSVTLKDYKANCRNKPTCRLVNPRKAEIGRISKDVMIEKNKNIVHTVEAKLNIKHK